MAEEWELKALERRVDSLENDRERAREEKDRRWNRRADLMLALLWTFYVAALTTMIVLAATGHLHHH
jgi:hypothetical protein